MREDLWKFVAFLFLALLTIFALWSKNELSAHGEIPGGPTTEKVSLR
jgi:hypothetical protein